MNNRTIYQKYNTWSGAIILKDTNRTITNNHKLAETFNNFFSNITQNLKIDSNLEKITGNLTISNPVSKEIKKYEKYPSIIEIKEKMKNKNMSFSFSFVTKETILNELRKLNPKKACQESDIPVKIIKENLDIVSNFVYNNFNNSLFSSNFPSHLKNATITPIFKKKDRDNVENYRPVSILPNLSKIYERCMYIQIYEYLNKILSKWQCSFRQGHSAQHCLLVMAEKWRQWLDNGGVSGALLTDLSITFDCILHGLLVAKLGAYDFDYILCKCCKANSQTENKEKKLMMRLVSIVKLCSEFHKALY